MKILILVALLCFAPTTALAREVDVVAYIGIYFILPLFIIIGIVAILLLSATGRSYDSKRTDERTAKKYEDKDVNLGP